MRSLLSLLFCRESPHWAGSPASDHFCGPPLDLSALSMSFVICGDHNWTQYSLFVRCIWNEMIQFLLVMLLHMLHRIQFASLLQQHTAGSHSTCCLSGPPHPFPQSCFPVTQIPAWTGCLLSQVQDLAFVFVKLKTILFSPACPALLDGSPF